MEEWVDGGQSWCWDCGLLPARLGLDTGLEMKEEKNE
jgi:hypothetical protein